MRREREQKARKDETASSNQRRVSHMRRGVMKNVRGARGRVRRVVRDQTRRPEIRP